MKSVNLIPRDVPAVRSGDGSGVAVYVLLAGLAAVVAMVALWAIAAKQVDDRTGELRLANARIAAAEKRAGDSAAYVAFAKLANNRVMTVTKLSTTRFDWAHAMREVSRVLPADVWLTGMNGVSGASDAAPSPATNAAPAPTIVIVGCTRSQAKVARLLARLRTIDGVRKVSLKSSEKPDVKGDEGCPANRATDPRFSISLAFVVPGAPKETVDGTGQVTAAASPAGSTASTTSATTSSAPAADG
jgi:Tfp pilus assembly protein PilN